MKTALPNPRVGALLVVLALIWGASWPAVKVGVSAMPPVWFACLRYVVATVCGFVVVLAGGELKRPSPSDWQLVAVSGVLQMAAYSALTAANANRSVRASASRPSSCSGAMYGNEPIISPSSDNARLNVVAASLTRSRST